jgi:hypothetical protein
LKVVLLSVGPLAIASLMAAQGVAVPLAAVQLVPARLAAVQLVPARLAAVQEMAVLRGVVRVTVVGVVTAVIGTASQRLRYPMPGAE